MWINNAFSHLKGVIYYVGILYMELEQLDLADKINDLSARIETKEQLSEQYKTLVKERLGIINKKILDLLAKQKAVVGKIKDESKTKLTSLGKKLGDLRTQDKKEGEDALKKASATQDELSGQLTGATDEIGKLQEKLNQPNPDVEALKKSVEKLNEQLTESVKTQDEMSAHVGQLEVELEKKNSLINDLSKSSAGLLDLVTSLIEKVEKMSITDADIEEAKKLFDETQKLLEEKEEDMGGDDDGDLGIANMFDTKDAGPVPPGNDSEIVDSSTKNRSPAEDQLDDKLNEISPEIEAQGKAAEEEGDTWHDVIPEPDNTDGPASSPVKTRTRKERQELSDIKKRERYGKDLEAMTKAAGVGGRTRRRKKRVKTIKKGGYIIRSSKSSRKKKHGKKKRRTSASTTSSGSSSGSSKSSKSKSK